MLSCKENKLVIVERLCELGAALAAVDAVSFRSHLCFQCVSRNLSQLERTYTWNYQTTVACLVFEVSLLLSNKFHIASSWEHNWKKKFWENNSLRETGWIFINKFCAYQYHVMPIKVSSNTHACILHCCSIILQDGRTALHYAALYAKEDVVKSLISKRVDVGAVGGVCYCTNHLTPFS